MRSWLILLFLLGNLVFPKTQILQQNSVTFSDAAIFYTFGNQVRFQITIASPGPIREASLFIQPEGEGARIEPVSINSQGQGITDYNARLHPLRPYARTYFWYRVVLVDSQETTSQKYWFDYDDNRFKWEKLENGSFQVHWYGRDLAFGQNALNIADEGLHNAEIYLPYKLQSPLKIFIYSSTNDLQSALQLDGLTWAAGSASPDLHTILISSTPGPDEKLELERQIPHEITHVLQYQMVGDAYQRLPVWLVEGMASLAELYPNPDYQGSLQKAIDTKTLLPIKSLCASFPHEASGAYLAYAESASFVRYIHQKYGTSGLQNLIRQYQDGLGCEEGTMAGLGSSLSQLEIRWRQESLGIDAPATIWRNLSPYLVILALLLIPFFITLLVYLNKANNSVSDLWIKK
jgi:hypothetical protein